jgi:hypothetical protein
MSVPDGTWSGIQIQDQQHSWPHSCTFFLQIVIDLSKSTVLEMLKINSRSEVEFSFLS